MITSLRERKSDECKTEVVLHYGTYGKIEINDGCILAMNGE